MQGVAKSKYRKLEQELKTRASEWLESQGCKVYYLNIQRRGMHGTVYQSKRTPVGMPDTLVFYRKAGEDRARTAAIEFKRGIPEQQSLPGISQAPGRRGTVSEAQKRELMELARFGVVGTIVYSLWEVMRFFYTKIKEEPMPPFLEKMCKQRESGDG